MPSTREKAADSLNISHGTQHLNSECRPAAALVSGGPTDPPERLLDPSARLALARASASDHELFAALHTELRRIARAAMLRERPAHTLTPTRLVNEAFIEPFTNAVPADFWSDPTRARGVIARLMQQILNDHADARPAAKRGGDRQRVTLDLEGIEDQEGRESRPTVSAELPVTPEVSETVLAVREAIAALEAVAARQAEVLRLSFYGGLPRDEIAAVLGVSEDTVKLDLRKAKAFLRVATT